MYVKAVYCQPVFLTSLQSTSWKMFLDESQAGIKIAGRNVSNFRYADMYSNGRKWRQTKESLDEGERGQWKAGSKLNIQKTKIITSSPITSWQIWGKVQTVTRFYFLGLVTADGDYSHEIKRCLLLRRKAMTNLDSILKSRDITLPTKVYIVTATVFSVVMYRCKSCTIKKAERWKIDAFELWRRLLRVPWAARRSNQ